MVKINLDKMDTYKFIVCILVFILIFCFIFMLQTKSVINMQNKLLSRYLDGEEPTTTSTYTSPATTNKYQNY